MHPSGTPSLPHPPPCTQSSEAECPDHLCGQHITGTLVKVGVIGGSRRRRELKSTKETSLPHLSQSGENVVSNKRKMLHTSTFVVFQISLDLALPFRSVNRLVQRQQHRLRVVPQKHRVQPALARSHVLRGELRELVESAEAFQVPDRRRQFGHVPDGVVQPPNPVVQLRKRRRRGLESRQEPPRRIRPRRGVLVAYVAEHDVAVEAYLREAGAAVEESRWRRRLGAVGDAGVEGGFRVGYLQSDGTDAEAVLGGEGEAGGGVEGWKGGGGGASGGSGESGRVRSGEEEGEVTGAEEVGGVDLVSGGEIGFCHNRHSKSPRESAGRVGSIGAPELDVVEAVNLKAVRFRVGSDEVCETNELKPGLDIAGLSSLTLLFLHYLFPKLLPRINKFNFIIL